MDTLVSSIGKFIPKREDAVSAALEYMLSHRKSASRGLHSLVRKGCADFAQVETFLCQPMHHPEAHPDLVGRDGDGTERLVIEAKFDAPLGGQQPNGYIGLLPENGPSVLLFLVRQQKLDALWQEICSKACESHELLENPRGLRWRCATIDGKERYLTVATWGELTSCMHQELGNDIIECGRATEGPERINKWVAIALFDYDLKQLTRLIELNGGP